MEGKKPLSYFGQYLVNLWTGDASSRGISSYVIAVVARNVLLQEHTNLQIMYVYMDMKYRC